MVRTHFPVSYKKAQRHRVLKLCGVVLLSIGHFLKVSLCEPAFQAVFGHRKSPPQFYQNYGGLMAESKGFFRCTPVRLRVASLLDHVGKNSPPDCFLPQTASAPSLFESLFLFCQSKKQALRPAFRFGGEQGIRTLEQALTCYTISNRAPSASSDNSPYSFSLFN